MFKQCKSKQHKTTKSGEAIPTYLTMMNEMKHWWQKGRKIKKDNITRTHAF